MIFLSNSFEKLFIGGLSVAAQVAWQNDMQWNADSYGTQSSATS